MAPSFWQRFLKMLIHKNLKDPTLAAEYLDRMLAGIGPFQPPFCEKETSSGLHPPSPSFCSLAVCVPEAARSITKTPVATEGEVLILTGRPMTETPVVEVNAEIAQKLSETPVEVILDPTGPKVPTTTTESSKLGATASDYVLVGEGCWW